jgi:hypothetical protein
VTSETPSENGNETSAPSESAESRFTDIDFDDI